MTNILASTFGTSTYIYSQQSQSTILQPTDLNCPTTATTSLHNHLYICNEPQSDKQNPPTTLLTPTKYTLQLPTLKPPSSSTTTSNTLYEQQRRIIDLEQQNFKLRQALLGADLPTTPTETELKLRLESTIKQYEMRLQKQEELHKIEIWRMKEDMESLSYQLREERDSREVERENREQQQEEGEERQQKQQHCPICSDGQVITRMCTMYNTLQDQHKGCLQHKKQHLVKLTALQSQIHHLTDQLQTSQREQSSIESQNTEAFSTIQQLQQKINELLREKTEHESNNLRLIEENAKLKLREEQRRVKEEYGREQQREKEELQRQAETNRSVAVQEEGSGYGATVKSYAMKSSIIDKLKPTGTLEFKRPSSSTSYGKSNLSFDLQQHPLHTAYDRFQRPAFQRPGAYYQRQPSSLLRNKSATKIPSTYDRLKLTSERSGIQAILSTSSQNLDTFRPKKYTAPYKYNI